MKYIKKYEWNDFPEVPSKLYKVDDYVIINLDSETIKTLNNKWDFYPNYCVKLIVWQVTPKTNENIYYVETYDVKTNKDLIFWIREIDIKRKATKEEILEFESKRNSIKFNI